jgi:hypothetical protein
VDGLLDHVRVELGLRELGPDLGLVAAVGKFVGAVDGLDVLEQDLDRANVLAELLVDVNASSNRQYCSPTAIFAISGPSKLSRRLM